MKLSLFFMFVVLIFAESTIQADVPGPSFRRRHPVSSGGFVFLPDGTRHEIPQSVGPMTIRPAPVPKKKLPAPIQEPSREGQLVPPPRWETKNWIEPHMTTPPPRYPYALQVSLTSIETVPWTDVDSLFPELDLWTPWPGDSSILANAPPPMGPPPEPSDPGPFPADVPEETNSTPDVSAMPVDVGPPPVPEATRPIPMVIAGVAATAGVVLLGIWITKQGRPGGSQDQ